MPYIALIFLFVLFGLVFHINNEANLFHDQYCSQGSPTEFYSKNHYDQTCN